MASAILGQVMKPTLDINALRSLLIRISIIIFPSYFVAYITEKMVYVVPTVAASVMAAAGLSEALSINRRTEDDSSDNQDDDAQQDSGQNVDYGNPDADLE